jgi:hypothetical protein
VKSNEPKPTKPRVNTNHLHAHFLPDEYTKDQLRQIVADLLRERDDLRREASLASIPPMRKPGLRETHRDHLKDGRNFGSPMPRVYVEHHCFGRKGDSVRKDYLEAFVELSERIDVDRRDYHEANPGTWSPYFDQIAILFKRLEKCYHRLKAFEEAEEALEASYASDWRPHNAPVKKRDSQKAEADRS